METSATERNKAEKDTRDIGGGAVRGSVNSEDTSEQKPEGCRSANSERSGASSYKQRQQQVPSRALVACPRWRNGQKARVARGARPRREERGVLRIRETRKQRRNDQRESGYGKEEYPGDHLRT